jgi:2-polyprenyl-6-methoxyphenol hydroxylase-like FAD-dependent oxidoreductase
LANTAEEFVLHSTRNDTILTEANFSGEAKERIGFGYMRVKRTDLISVLLNAVQKQGILIHYKKSIVSIDDQAGNVTAVFSDGTRDTADILLGCDGIHSSVRALHVDSSIQPEYSGVSAMFALLKRSELPGDAPPITCFNSTFTTDGVLAVISCTASNDEIFWFFSGEVPVPESGEHGWEEHRRKEVQEVKSSILDVLRQVQGRWGDFVRDLIRRSPSISFTPIYRMPLGKTWSRGRCLLVGDAAHAIQPHAGQGTSMALEDVFVLSRVIKQHPNDSVKEVFLKYDEIRRPRITRIYTASEQNGQLWKKTGPWGLWFRESMAWAVFSLPPLLGWKRGVIPLQDLIYDPEETS